MTAQATLQPWVPVGAARQRLLDAHRNVPRPLPRITILGAGIAGLCAAYELGRLGYPVEVYEGSGRIGGRIFTHRFPDGTWIERGAMRVPNVHDYTLYYLDEAGLSDQRFVFLNENPEHRGLFDVGGVRQAEPEFGRWVEGAFALNDTEKRLFGQAPRPSAGLGALIGHYLQPVMSQLDEADLRALAAGDFSRPKLQALDFRSLADELQIQVRSGRASAAGVALVGRAASLSAVTRWSLAALIRDSIHQPDTSHFYGLHGGWSRLPEALADALPENVQVDLHARVIDVENTGRGGEVVLQTRGGRTTRPFDHLLCTLPFPTMRSMRLPGFSQSKRQAVHGLRWAPGAKVFFGYPRRWWEEGGGGIAGGRSVSDLDGGAVTLPRQLYYPSDRRGLDPRAVAESVPPPGPEGAVTTADGVELRGMFQLYAGSGPDLSAFADLLRGPAESGECPGALLAAYLINQGAEEVRDQPESRVVARVRAAVARFHGEGAPAPTAHDVWSWDRHEWSGGAFAITPPRDLAAHSAASRRAEGRVFFAGDHVSIAPGWIQGSLESSLRETAALLETVHED